jgi:hypothetical protein
MNKQSHTQQPENMLSALYANPMSGGVAAKAMQSWLDGAGEAQSRLLDYWSRRTRTDSAMLGKIAKCKSPAEVWATQVEWANALYEDMAAEGRYAAERFSRAAKMATNGTTRAD